MECEPVNTTGKHWKIISRLGQKGQVHAEMPAIFHIYTEGGSKVDGIEKFLGREFNSGRVPFKTQWG